MKFELGNFQSDNEYQKIKIFDDDGGQISIENYKIMMMCQENELMQEQNRFLENIGGQLKEMNSIFLKEEESPK